MTKRFDINILKEIFSYINIYNLTVSNDTNITEKTICMLMSITNERKRKCWINEFKYKVAKIRYEENCLKKMKDKANEIINHIKFIFSFETVTIPDDEMNYVSSRVMYFAVNISNYGSFDITLINSIDNNNINIWVNNIVEPEYILDGGYSIRPDDFQDLDELDGDYYFKNIYKEGDIESIIKSIWFTPYWEKKMPETNDYVVIN